MEHVLFYSHLFVLSFRIEITTLIIIQKVATLLAEKTLTYLYIGRIVGLHIPRLFDEYYSSFILTFFQYFTTTILRNYYFIPQFFFISGISRRKVKNVTKIARAKKILLTVSLGYWNTRNEESHAK